MRRSLHHSRETLGALIDASPFAIVSVDLERNVLIWNRAAEQIFGYDHEEVIGKGYPLVPPSEAAEFERLFERAATGEQLSGIEVQRRRKDGTLIEIRFSSAAIRGRTGEIESIVYAMEDVTESKATAERLHQAQKMEALGQLTGGVAHDFNNILSIVSMNLDLLADIVPRESEASELIEAATRGAMRGAELTQRLLAFGRRQPLSPSEVDVNRLLPELAFMLRRTLGSYIEVKVRPGVGVWPAHLDVSQLENAVLNLAINARDAMPDGGELLLESANVELDEAYAAQHMEVTPGPYVMVSVTDSGTGMPPEQVARVFEPFYTTKESGRGTGLGLSMVHGFIKQSGGHVKIYSEEGYGTSVKLYFPVSEESAAHYCSEQPAIDAKEESDSRLVLVVEDEAAVREGALKVLRGLGYRTLEAEDGWAALEALEREPEIALVFTDIVMPRGMNGFELAERVRQRWPEKKLLYASGYSEAFVRDDEDGRVEAQLLMKPYRKQELALALRAALDQEGG